jgi:hypothetical protein
MGLQIKIQTRQPRSDACEWWPRKRGLSSQQTSGIQLSHSSHLSFKKPIRHTVLRRWRIGYTLARA